MAVPFCKAKCSFCNFASGVFAAGEMQGYVDRLCDEIRGAHAFARRLGVEAPRQVDSVYLGGGTPSLLEPAMVAQLFHVMRCEFDVTPDAEITVECAPDQVSEVTLAALQMEGLNRLSFGVQSFIDAEAAAVGRLHTGAGCRRELERMQRAGVPRLAVDLIVGLPGQTRVSWRQSIEQVIASGVEHVSLYMLEVDEDSRLGREALAGGQRYGAALLPQDDDVADWYTEGCAWLEDAGLAQYEISNFARAEGASQHNRKYWTRENYLGFGLDAHSMLRDGVGGVRWANADAMGTYLGKDMGARGFVRQVDRVDGIAAFEETLFLGLRLVEGVSVSALREEFGTMIDQLELGDLVTAGLLKVEERLRLTARGRMISNEVFERVLLGRAREMAA